MIVLLATICDTILFDLRYKTLYFLQQKGLNLTLLESIDLLKGIKTGRVVLPSGNLPLGQDRKIAGKDHGLAGD